MKKYLVVDEGMNASTNHITFKVPDSSENTINNSSSQIIQSDGGCIQIYNDGTNGWFCF